MGDPRRFQILADFMQSRVYKEARIADVAAGKGHLSLALSQRGFKNLIAFEPNPRPNGPRGLPLRARNFQISDAKDFDVIVGMHPDGATEEIVCGAAKYSCLMFLVPCCAITSRTTQWTTNNWRGWIDHILQLCHKHNLKTQRLRLPMVGRNQLIWTP